MTEKNAPTQSWLIGRRYFSPVIVLVFVILSAVAFSICYRHHTINTEHTLKDDRSNANLLSLLLEERLKKIVGVMESYSNRPLLLRAVRDKNAEKAAVHLISLTKSNPDIDSVIITDKQGTLWAIYPKRPEVLGKNFAYRDWYKDVSKEWKSSISGVYLRVVAEKDLAVSICIPIFNETGQVIGILQNTHRTVSLSNIIKQMPLDSGTFITVTDRKGQIIYSSEHDVKTEIKPYPFHAGMKKAMAAKNITFAVDDPNLGGRTRYISFAPVANIGWTVFVERDRRIILLSESGYYVQVTAIAFLLFLSVILFLFYSRKQVMAQQILEQLQVEKQIRAGAERYKSYIEVTMQLAWTTNDQGEIVEDNPSWSKYTGRGYEEYKGFGWIEDIHPDDRDRTGQIWRKAVAEKSFYEIEYRVRRHDGVYRDYLARGIPLLAEDGSVREWVGTCIDITDRKQADEVLRESESRFRQLAESLPQLVWTCQPDGPCDYLSRQWIEFTGVPEAQQLGFGWLEQLHPDDRAPTVAAWEAAIASGAGFRVEFRIRRHDGEYRWFDTQAVRLCDAEGHTVKWFGSNTNITERKQAEEALARRADELAQFNAACVDRELRMVELKEQVNELARQLGQPALYEMEFVSGAVQTPPPEGGSRGPGKANPEPENT